MATHRLVTTLAFTLLSHGIVAGVALHANEQQPSIRAVQQRAVSYGKIHLSGQMSNASAAIRKEHAEPKKSEAGQEGVLRRASGGHSLQINHAGVVLEEGMLHQQSAVSHFKISASDWLGKASDFQNGHKEWRAEHKPGRVMRQPGRGRHLQIDPAGELLEEKDPDPEDDTIYYGEEMTECKDSTYLWNFVCLADCNLLNEMCKAEDKSGKLAYKSCTVAGVGSGTTGRKCKSSTTSVSEGKSPSFTSTDCPSAISFSSYIKTDQFGNDVSFKWTITATCKGATWSPGTIHMVNDPSEQGKPSFSMGFRRDSGVIDTLTATHQDDANYWIGSLLWSNGDVWAPKREYYVASSNSACSKPITSSSECNTASTRLKKGTVGEDQAWRDRCYGCLVDIGMLFTFNSNTDGECKGGPQVPVCKTDEKAPATEKDIFDPASIENVDDLKAASKDILGGIIRMGAHRSSLSLWAVMVPCYIAWACSQ